MDSLLEQFDNLYRDLPDRVAAVIDSKGDIQGTELVFKPNPSFNFEGGFVLSRIRVLVVV